ncbi:MAG TPA: hypothetical protein VG938_15840 [Verrucomicrobiae bacterium]|jgi:hypothetical protein|nr:hypothetical protein [Verrucomicrobiae bacterium]
MNTQIPFAPEMMTDLRAYLGICDDAFALATRENQALTGAGEYQSFDFFQRRRGLLPRLENALVQIRKWREIWLRVPPEERASCSEVKELFQSVQGLLMKLLLLDRENQQALLRRGLVPPRHLATAAVQQPNHVANVYKRHLPG